MSFTNKIILITGASSGIGHHAAVHLAIKGASVAIVGRNEKRLNKVAEEIKSAGSPEPLAIVADISTDAERIMNETINRFGKLDVLINNAGVYSNNSIDTIDMDEYDRIMNTNVRSVVQLTKLAVPHLEKTKGNILNVSSIAGLRMRPNKFVYSVSKAAVNQVTKSAALDLAPKGIRVNAINPGAIQTQIFETSFGMTPEQVKEFLDNIKNTQPIRRIGQGSDTSAAIEYLIGESASFLTGTLLTVDGGALLIGQ